MKQPPEKYYQVSKTQLSVARFAGGAKINGHYYYYNPMDDTLTLEDPKKKKRKT